MEQDQYGSPLWYTLDDETERCASVINTCNALEELHKERTINALGNIELYEGKRLGGLYAGAYLKSVDYIGGDDFDKIKLNEARAIVNTAIAKVAGKQRPRAQFACSEADWTIRRRAKKLEKFIEAVMLQRQQNLTDAYDVGLLMFRDMCVVDSGWMKVWADASNKCVRIQRVLPWEILVDPNEAATGEPQNLFHIYGYDKYLLAEQFPEHREAILAAMPMEQEDMENRTVFSGQGRFGLNLARMVKVREGWRLSPAPGVPGKHSIIVHSAMGDLDLTVDKDHPNGEEWNRTFFPFVGGTWEPHMMGIYGASLIDNVASLCEELNSTIQRRAEAETLGSNMIILARQGAVVNKADLEDNRPCIVIDVAETVQDVGTAVQFRTPDAVSQGSVQWAQQLQDWIHDASGVSPQDTAATKEPGLDSGVAIREIRDIGSERFAIQWQRYEKIMAIDLPRNIIACMEELEQEEPNVMVRWPGGDYYRDLKWKDCKLEENQYHIQIYAVSGLINTPADRLALATELVDRGFMTRETYLRVIQAKDIDSELGKGNSASQWVDRCIEQWLDATPADLESGKFRYRHAPPSYLGAQVLTDCILQAGLAYLDADMENAPQWNLRWFETFMQETDNEIQKLLAKQALLANASRGTAAGAQALQQSPAAPPPPPQ